jgi:isoquinoline 1-oxidoreductase
LTWAYFRPAALIDAEASLDADGTITSWHFTNVNSGPSAVESPYKIARSRGQFVRANDPPLRHGSYRALAATANNFARECFMDELAVAAGRDPLEFRLAHLENPRLKAVLEEAAKRFDFTTRREDIKKNQEPNVGVGLACGTEKGSFVATCAEVKIDKSDGKIIIRRICQVFECGAITNPENLLSQVQGSVIMGIGPILREAMDFDSSGLVRNASLWKYPVPRQADVPQLDVHLLNRPDLPSVGAGETPLITVAPAVANAVYDASKLRVRELPLRLTEARS